MSNIEIRLNTSGVGELLHSDAVAGYCSEIANGITSKCSGNYSIDQQSGKYRSVTRVKTNDKDTYFRNLQNNELLKAMR